MIWNKYVDWLPIDNAKAQVTFYKKDLEYSQAYLKYVISFKSKKLKDWAKHLKIAEKDVSDSTKNLEKARKKLLETVERDKR